MRKTNLNFTPPTIIGVLGARRPSRAWLTQLSRIARKIDPTFVCLPFEVEARYLKNTIACLKLMDIVALVIHGSHRRALVKYLPKRKPPVKRTATVDVVIRHGKQFRALALPEGTSLRSLLEQHLPSVGKRKPT